MTPSITRWLAPDNAGSRYHSSLRHGDLIFVSGQLGAHSGDDPIDFGDQLKMALLNMFAAVEALGGNRASILKVNGYLARLEDFPTYHSVYAEMFDAVPLPARTTVQIAGFRPPVLVEIDAVAAAMT